MLELTPNFRPPISDFVPPEGKELGLDNRNVKLYEYTNGKGEKIHIRQDKPAPYGQGGQGDQGPHFNAGPANEKLKQHYYYGGQ